MGENTRYIHIRHSKIFPRQSYSGIGIRHPPSRSPRRFPCSSFAPVSPLSVLPCRWGGKIESMIKQPIVSPIVASLPCRLPCRASRSRPVPSSHQLIYLVAFTHLIPCLPYLYSPVLVACPHPVPLPAVSTSKAGRLQPYRRIAAACPSFHLMRCHGMS